VPRLGDVDEMRLATRRRLERSLVPVACFVAACIGASIGIVLVSSHVLGFFLAIGSSLAAWIGGIRWLDRPHGAGYDSDRGVLGDIGLVLLAVATAFLVGWSVLGLEDADLAVFIVSVSVATGVPVAPLYAG
jgi:hypothetical protein